MPQRLTIVLCVSRVSHLSEEAGVQALPQTRPQLWSAGRQNIPRQETRPPSDPLLVQIYTNVISYPVLPVGAGELAR